MERNGRCPARKWEAALPSPHHLAISIRTRSPSDRQRRTGNLRISLDKLAHGDWAAGRDAKRFMARKRLAEHPVAGDEKGAHYVVDVHQIDLLAPRRHLEHRPLSCDSLEKGHELRSWIPRPVGIEEL